MFLFSTNISSLLLKTNIAGVTDAIKVRSWVKKVDATASTQSQSNSPWWLLSKLKFIGSKYPIRSIFNNTSGFLETSDSGTNSSQLKQTLIFNVYQFKARTYLINLV